ncbi:glycosyltransferase [Chthonobacter rhizosphaerae]|uniref:glycosyltransferase n=1 Tax=Chthonobacter rhizosphaerae TaxID=2735553 RepID=UPI001FE38E95|nr:glycosyltransferase [Chthonobacter rhizosphaerae]
MDSSAGRIDVDFSLAIHNRTGKYFIGRDIIEDNADLVGAVLYGRLSSRRVPSYLVGRLAGRLMSAELMRRMTGAPGLPPVRRKAPVLHLDPLTALNYQLGPWDIVLVHDVGPLTHPDLFEPTVCDLYKAAYRHIAASGPRLVFVSETSRAAYLSLFDCSASTTVIYPHIRTDVKSADQAVAGVERPFLLTVGSVGARKGQLASIAGYARSGLYERGIDYVLCGGPEEPGHAAVVAQARRTPGVLLLPYVRDTELTWLYRHAAGFVLASRLEGFGMPVAEAIASGLVPAVSRNTVLEEVAGEAALTFDPFDVDDIARTMAVLCALRDDEKAERLTRMSARLAQYSRDRFSREWRVLLQAAVREA